MNPWEDFARTDPYFYIDTEFDRIRDQPDAIDRFYETGRATSNELLAEVAPLLPARSLAIEIGCGVGRVLLGHARHFETVRGVDVAPRMLSILADRASDVAIENAEGFLAAQSWDEPGASADYIYSLHVFQHIEGASEVAEYISRIGRALRQGGIAQLHFDTRPPSLLASAHRIVPDRWLSRTQRRGIRRVRRDPRWVRRQILVAGLEIVNEREPRSALHWFVLRRRYDEGSA